MINGRFGRESSNGSRKPQLRYLVAGHSSGRRREDEQDESDAQREDEVEEQVEA